MKARVTRLMLLAAACTVAFWTPSVSVAWDACPGQSCAFWRGICDLGSGTFDQTNVGRCIQEDSTTTVLYYAVCTPDVQAPWSMYCTGI